MPLPPLAASERLLARFAAAAAWGCAAAGLACALWPRGLLRVLALGGPATSSVGMRLFGALCGGALLGVAAGLRRTALRPREERGGMHALLATLGGGALFSLLALLRARGPGQPESATLPLAVAAALLLVLFLCSSWVFIHGAPGVNFGPVPAPGPEETAAVLPVQLGVRVAAAPEPDPLAAEAKAASGSSR